MRLPYNPEISGSSPVYGPFKNFVLVRERRKCRRRNRLIDLTSVFNDKGNLGETVFRKFSAAIYLLGHKSKRTRYQMNCAYLENQENSA